MKSRFYFFPYSSIPGDSTVTVESRSSALYDVDNHNNPIPDPMTTTYHCLTRYMIAMIMTVLSTISYAGTIPVTNTNDANAGSLRQAVIDAMPGDTITFDASLDMDTIKLVKEIVIDKNLTILGNNTTNTIIDGMGDSRIFHITSGDTVAIQGVTLQNGNAVGATLSGDGGGILNQGVLTVSNSVVRGNTAFDGGGLYNWTAKLTLTNSVVRGNTSSNQGGGIQNIGILAMNNSALSGNTASSGGGVYNGFRLTVTNSMVSGNTASSGGGVYNFDSGSLTTMNSTVSGNAASTRGGGVFINGVATLTNSIIAKNAAPSDADIRGSIGVPNGTHNLIGDGSGQTTLVHGVDGNQVGASGMLIDPGFVMDVPAAPSTGGDLRLRCDSPAIDAGDDAAATAAMVPATDLNGLPRQVGTIDIGAHERPADTGSRIVTTLADDGPGSLRDMVRIACPEDTIRFDASLDMDTIKLITEIIIDKNLTIIGNDTTKTIIDGMGTSRIFHILAAATVAIEGVTLQNGNGEGANRSGNGGAIYNQGTLTMSNSSVSGSTASFNGGGIENDGSLALMNSVVSGNSANSSGGGIENGGSLALTNSVVSGNSANFIAGGIFNSDLLTLTNSIVSGNTADIVGGIYNTSGTLTLTNSIIAKNTHFGFGPDIQNDGTITDGGHNLIGDGAGQTTIMDGVNGNQVGTSGSPIDPLFVMDVPAAPTMGGDLRLRCGSPAIDAGDNAAATAAMVPATDINGHPRIVTKTIDIGAYEFQAAEAPAPITLVTTTKGSGCGSLRFAICNAMPGDTITFDASLDMMTIQLVTEIVIDKNLTILGNGRTKTIIDGMGTSRIFFITSGATVAIEGVTLQNGNGIGATRSGAGGAIFNQGTMTVSNSSVSGNTADRRGGGIFSGGTLILTNSDVSGNSADNGGGIFNTSGTLTLTNSVVSGNSAVDVGGGIFNISTLTLKNSVVSGNRSSDGGGIFNQDDLTLTNSIIAKNTDSSSRPDIGNFDTITDGGHNLIGDGSGQTTIMDGVNGNQVGTRIIPIDPLFVMDVPTAPTTGGDLRLQAMSPAIDAGTPDTTGLHLGMVDIAGFPRILGQRIDIGAHEACDLRSDTLFLTTCDPSMAGTDIETFPLPYGCDSIFVTVTTYQPLRDTVYVSSCFASPPLHTVYTTAQGCDSVVTTITNTLSCSIDTLQLTSCMYDEVGTVVDRYTATDGSDSIVVTVTTFSGPMEQMTTYTCDPSEVASNTEVFCGTTCDSVVITNTEMRPEPCLLDDDPSGRTFKGSEEAISLVYFNGFDDDEFTFELIKKSTARFTYLFLKESEAWRIGADGSFDISGVAQNEHLDLFDEADFSVSDTALFASNSSVFTNGFVIGVTGEGKFSTETFEIKLIDEHNNESEPYEFEIDVMPINEAPLASTAAGDILAGDVPVVAIDNTYTVDPHYVAPVVPFPLVFNPDLTTLHDADIRVREDEYEILLREGEDTSAFETEIKPSFPSGVECIIESNGTSVRSAGLIVSEYASSKAFLENLRVICDAPVELRIEFTFRDNGVFTTHRCPGFHPNANEAGVGCQRVTIVERVYQFISSTSLRLASDKSKTAVEDFEELVAKYGQQSEPKKGTALRTGCVTELASINETTCDPFEVGIFEEVLVGQGSNGCDSLIRRNVTLASSVDTIYTTTCDPLAACVTVDQFVNRFGCDSTTVTFIEFAPPVVTCMDSTVYLDASGEVEIDSSVLMASVTDACGIASVIPSRTSFSCADIGANVITLTATDRHGNESECSSTLTVRDTVSPVVTCMDATVYLDASGAVEIDSSVLMASVTDACGIASVIPSQTSFSCADIGANVITLTATDRHGNESECSSTLTVRDTFSPVVTCMDATVYLDASGEVEIDSSVLMASVTDACGIASVIPSRTSFSCVDVGANVITLTATDRHGNVSTCSSTLTVRDTVSPVVTCMDATVYLDASGEVEIDSSVPMASVTDACGIASVIPSRTSFSCADVGANVITLTATDGHGNVSECSSTLTVRDTVSPVVTCMDATVYLDASGVVEIDSSVLMTSVTDACGIASVIPSRTSFSCADIGANVITLTATDLYGNQSTCMATVTVVKVPLMTTSEITGPTTICPDLSSISYSASAVAGATGYQWSYSGAGVTIHNNGTTQVFIDFGNDATGGTLTVDVLDVCGDVSSSAAHAVVMGSGEFCALADCARQSIYVDDELLRIVGAIDIYHVSNSLQSDALVPSGRSLVFKAGQEIVLYPGFSVEQGSVFDAIIEACDED